MSGRKLGDVIRDANSRFITYLQRDYQACDKKLAPLLLKLAEEYIEGKRAPKNLARAAEILNASTLSEAKFMLLRLAVTQGKYATAYHYLEYFPHLKCVCHEQNKTVSSPGSKKHMPTKLPNKSIGVLERRIRDCLKHRVSDLVGQIEASIGPEKAKVYQKEGTDKRFSPETYTVSINQPLHR